MKNVWILLAVLLAGFVGGIAGGRVAGVAIKKDVAASIEQNKSEIKTMAEQSKSEIKNEVQAAIVQSRNEVVASLEQTRNKVEAAVEAYKTISLKIGRFISSDTTAGEVLIRALSIELTKRGIKIDDSANYTIEGACQGVTVVYGLRDKTGNMVKEWQYTDSGAFYKFSSEKAAKEIVDVVRGYFQSRGGK